MKPPGVSCIFMPDSLSKRSKHAINRLKLAISDGHAALNSHSPTEPNKSE